MFPYISLPHLPLPFGQKIDVFGVLSTAGVITGALVAARAAKKYGPGDDTPLRDVVPWAVVIGLLGGHFMHIFAYHLELVHDVGLTLATVFAFAVAGIFIYRLKMSENARWVIFGVLAGIYYLVTDKAFPERHSDFVTTVKAWDGLSSMGGVLGALAGIFIFFRKEKIPLTPYVDALALGTAPGWAIARIGCYLVHDHPGWRTESPLAVAYPVVDALTGIKYGGPRYDLGLADFFVLASISALIWALRKKLYGTGMLMGLLATIYSVCRFSLDFVRADDLGFVDKRYAGLTPAQFVVMGIFAVGVRLLILGRQKAAGGSSPALTRQGQSS
ncbi:MAG: prolipoprotein diacylglyceryl transferase [Archangiaceae bacterium]|nr:prolipoprotein diacylglyceryl transferase [Archangiaceae bacterium]